MAANQLRETPDRWSLYQDLIIAIYPMFTGVFEKEKGVGVRSCLLLVTI